MLGLEVERAYFARGSRHVAGVDEVGRGPWAGPVIAAAVLVGPETPRLEGVDDSKQLTSRRREQLAAAIVSSLPYALGAASTREIDRLNIRRATALAMRRAVLRLPRADDTVILVDGLPVPELGMAHQAIVDGDAQSFAIACASIVAKTVRDRLMRLLAARYPDYGWDHNCGYGTPAHRAAIERVGVTPHHRRSFTPVAQRDLFNSSTL
ncbi:MAG: ribonuclease HII [Gemmatimonadetes bacterium]|nr:ribonuclease HII [Gemmatimonadota bacterium]